MNRIRRPLLLIALAAAGLLLLFLFFGERPTANVAEQTKSPAGEAVASGSSRSGGAAPVETLRLPGGAPSAKAGAASPDGSHPLPVQARDAAGEGRAEVDGIELAPRSPLPKGPLVRPPGEDLRIVVKFSDRLLARAQPDGGLSIAAAAETLSRVKFDHPVSFVPAFDPVTTGKLKQIGERAARNTGVAQADFEGTVIAMLPEGVSADERYSIALALHSLPDVEYVELDALDHPTPPPADIAPTTPDLVANQDYRESEASEGGVDADYAFSRGIRGRGVRLSDCEYGYNASHEDLVDSDITDSSRGPVHPDVASRGWDKHGTAVLGIGAGTRNSYGVTGIASDAEVHFYSEWTTNGGRRRESVTDAIAGSDAGDVVLLEMQTGDSNGDYVPAEYNSTIWTIVKAGTDAGVIVVAAAGNGSANLDSAIFDAYHARGDSGAIIVGAGSSNSSHLRRSFSTYGGRVDVQAWGGGVFSTGYGGFAAYGGDVNQRYTSSFSGTSSASAIVAPSVATIQSFCEEVLGYRLTPLQMRTLLRETGVQPATDQKIGPHVNIRNAILYFDRVRNLTATDGQYDGVAVSWDAVPNATDYEVYRAATDSSSSATLLGTSGGATGFVDTTLTRGEVGYYFVRPVTPLGRGEWSEADTGFLLTNPPELLSSSDTGRFDDDGLTNDPTPTIRGMATPGSAVAVFSNRDGQVGSATTDHEGEWTSTLATLSEGVHEIRFTESGGDPSSPIQIEIDTSAPAAPNGLSLRPEDDSGVADDDRITRALSPVLTGIAEADALVELLLDGNPLDSTITPGAFSLATGPLPEGTHSFSARATDAAGNTSASSGSLAVTIDRSPPVPVIARAPGQALFTTAGDVEFSIQFNEPVSGLDEGDLEVVSGPPFSDHVTYGGPLSYTVRIRDVSGEGAVFVRIPEGVLTDLAGNGNETTSGEARQVFVDFEGVTTLSFDPSHFSSVNGSFGPGDLDAFRFLVNQPRHFEFEISGPDGVRMEIRNGEGETIFPSPDSSAERSGDPAMVSLALAAGTYTLDLSAVDETFTGLYDFEMQGGDPAGSKPDGLVGRTLRGARGKNVYEGGGGQLFTLVSKRAGSVKGIFAVENDGDFAEHFRLGGSPGSKLFQTKYRSANGNVTAEMAAARYGSGLLLPGASAHVVSMSIKPSKRKLVRKARNGRLKVLRKTQRYSLIVVGTPPAFDSASLKVRTR